MMNNKNKFIEFCINNNILNFGEFTLKSKRISPYFFNAGLFNTGNTISKLGDFYANSIINSQIKFDMIFGPAYKGIHITTAASISLMNNYGKNYPISFNRKEEKKHGEGGIILGSPIKGKVMICDDVITAGTAIKDSIDIIKRFNAQLVGVTVAIDRQEKIEGHELSAVQIISNIYGIKINSIVNFTDIINYVRNFNLYSEELKLMLSYYNKYGVYEG